MTEGSLEHGDGGEERGEGRGAREGRKGVTVSVMAGGHRGAPAS